MLRNIGTLVLQTKDFESSCYPCNSSSCPDEMVSGRKDTKVTNGWDVGVGCLSNTSYSCDKVEMNTVIVRTHQLV